MIKYIGLFCNEKKEIDYILNKDYFYEDIEPAGECFEIIELKERMNNKEIPNIDLLIIEDLPEHIANVIKQSGKCEKDINIGICTKERDLLTILLLLHIPPKVITLDFELSTGIAGYNDSKELFEKNLEQTVKNIKDKWKNTKIIGMSQHADEERMTIFNDLLHKKFRSYSYLKNDRNWNNLGNQLIEIIDTWKDNPQFAFYKNGFEWSFIYDSKEFKLPRDSSNNAGTYLYWVMRNSKKYYDNNIQAKDIAAFCYELIPPSKKKKKRKKVDKSIMSSETENDVKIIFDDGKMINDEDLGGYHEKNIVPDQYEGYDDGLNKKMKFYSLPADSIDEVETIFYQMVNIIKSERFTSQTDSDKIFYLINLINYGKRLVKKNIADYICDYAEKEIECAEEMLQDMDVEEVKKIKKAFTVSKADRPYKNSLDTVGAGLRAFIPEIIEQAKKYKRDDIAEHFKKSFPPVSKGGNPKVWYYKNDGDKNWSFEIPKELRLD